MYLKATDTRKVCFWYKGQGQQQKAFDLVVIWKSFISKICMQNMHSVSIWYDSLSGMIQKSKVLYDRKTERQDKI